MKKSIIFILVIAFTISITAQGTKEIKVTEKAKTEFAKLYPKAENVKWGKEGSKAYEVEFKLNGLSTSIVIDKDGKVSETESEIAKADLPKGVEEFIAKNSKGWTITECAKIVDAKGKITYEAQISKGKEKKDLMFTNDGKPVVKKESKSEKNEKDGKEEK
jgi:hypothetical protein